MKYKLQIIIFALISIILFVYFYKESRENFAGTHQYDGVSQYDVLKLDKITPILTRPSNPTILPNDLTDNIYHDKFWVIKSNGFSDIYNYEDNGGNLINSNINNLIIDNTGNPNIKVFGKAVINSEINTNSKDKISDSKDEMPDNKDKISDNKDKIPKEVEQDKRKYKLFGLATNEYYNQYYLLYEYKIPSNDTLSVVNDMDYLNYQVYSYLLVKLKGDRIEVEHIVGPRSKIEINDVVYLSLGVFQLGPLIVKKL